KRPWSRESTSARAPVSPNGRAARTTAESVHSMDLFYRMALPCADLLLAAHPVSRVRTCPKRQLDHAAVISDFSTWRRRSRAAQPTGEWLSERWGALGELGGTRWSARFRSKGRGDSRNATRRRYSGRRACRWSVAPPTGARSTSGAL